MNVFDGMRQSFQKSINRTYKPLTGEQKTALQASGMSFNTNATQATPEMRAQFLKGTLAGLDRFEAKFNQLNGR